MFDQLSRYRSWIQQANRRPVNRAAALWFYGGVGYTLLLILPVGAWLGPSWETRILATATIVLGYSYLHSMTKLVWAGGLENWEAQFDEY